MKTLQQFLVLLILCCATMIPTKASCFSLPQGEIVDSSSLTQKEKIDVLSGKRFQVSFYRSANRKMFVKDLMSTAKQGDNNAQYNLGLCYLLGLNVGQNNNKASEWLKKAAAQNNAKAIELLRVTKLGANKDNYVYLEY